MANIDIKKSVIGVIAMLVLGLIAMAILPTMSTAVSTYITDNPNDTTTIVIVGLFTFIMAIVVLMKFLDQM